MKTTSNISKSGFVATILMGAAALSGCSYGAERNYVEIDNAAARPNTHILAVAVDYSRVQDPTGFFNTFPNGGIPRILERNARVYLVDADRGTITLSAEIDGFAGIPQPKQVWIEGWRDESLYFSLFGYGGDQRTGDDLSDERRVAYRVDENGNVQRVNALPSDLSRARNSGPLPETPFLRISKGHSEIDLGIDGHPYRAERLARFVLDDETGEPRLDFPNEE